MNRTAVSLPLLFREALSIAGAQAIDEWWARLDPPSRAEALKLWHDCAKAGPEMAVRIEVCFTDEPEGGAGDFWHSDYYEYLVNHEIYLFDVPGVHICTRHPMAAAAARRGVIPPDFACPLASTGCPMHKLLRLAAGKSVRLRMLLVAADGPGCEAPGLGG